MFTAIISILYYLVMAVWAVVYFLFTAVVFLLTVPFDKERVVLHAASRIWARSIVWINPLWSMKVTGRENVDRKGVYVITVNHQSMLDIPIMYVLPGLNFKWVSKDFVYKIPIFGEMLWMHGDIVIRSGSIRTTKEFMVKGKRRLKAGTSIVMFPEGTRSRDGEIHRFKSGAALLAQEAGVGILPCVINGAKGYIKGWRVQCTRFEVAIMPPVSAAEVAEDGVESVTLKIHDMSVAKLAELRITNPKPAEYDDVKEKQNEEDVKERLERIRLEKERQKE